MDPQHPHEEAMDATWVFAGSVFRKDDTGRDRYLADGGDFITVLNLPTAMLDVPMKSVGALESRSYEGFVDNMPPPGTPVTVVLTPKTAAGRRGAGWVRHRFAPSNGGVRGEMTMKAEFTAIINPPQGRLLGHLSRGTWHNGQGETIEETKDSLRKAIELILADRKADVLRGLPKDAIQDTVLIG